MSARSTRADHDRAPARCSVCSAGRSPSRSRSAGRACGSGRTGSRRSCSCRSSSIFGARVGRNRGGRRGARRRPSSSCLSGRCSSCGSGVSRRSTAPAPPARGCDAVKVLVVSGIWPPDVGGPASHAPDVAAFLLGRGHEVDVVTTAVGARARGRIPVQLGVARHPEGRASPAHRRARRASRAPGRRRVHDRACSGAARRGALVARRPYVVKLTADPAFERSRRRGTGRGRCRRVPGRRRRRSRRPRSAKARDVELRRAAHVFMSERVPPRADARVGRQHRSGSACFRIRHRRFPSSPARRAAPVAGPERGRRSPSQAG